MPARRTIRRTVPFRSSWCIVDCLCTEVHTMAWVPSASVIWTLKLHGKATALVVSGARPSRCCIPVRNSSVSRTRECVTV
jgi:hypothetical protein